jgi:hypothetical protein
MYIKKLTALLVTFAFVFSPMFALAQTPTAPSASSSDQTSAADTTVDCSQYYTFDSVQANLSTPITSVVSGTSITFSGTLQNENPYPIVGGGLYVKIFKSRSASDANGPDVVDQFQVKDGIVIPGNGSVPISFSWQVPSYAESGDYSLATCFTNADKFNLLGLSFTDDVVGNTVPFTVSGEQNSGVACDNPWCARDDVLRQQFDNGRHPRNLVHPRRLSLRGDNLQTARLLAHPHHANLAIHPLTFRHPSCT